MQLSQFLRGGKGFVSHFCPACRELHTIHVDIPNEMGCKWIWDRNIVIPTFSPSINIEYKRGSRLTDRCHYTLLAGVLSFQTDCSHVLKGVTMPLPALPLYCRERNFL